MEGIPIVKKPLPRSEVVDFYIFGQFQKKPTLHFTKRWVGLKFFGNTFV
jgi:hypothetical protein